ncbi:MAG: hypothetical protein AB8E74_10475 [Prochlorococcus sp.]|nr:hypothetical protein [Prochlorococcaceae cyanobacterium Fu_MAG_50]
MANSDLERELRQAVAAGRWKTDEEKDAEQAVAKQQTRLAQKLLARDRQVRRRQWASLGLLTGACLVPPLWPVALVGSAMMFPRTSKRLLLCSLLLTASGALLIGSLLWLTLFTPQKLPAPSATPKSFPASGLPNQRAAGDI